ncbi:M24 family metallopeptidase [Paenibacillus hemerocallicola]|uniref:M24 family metallopeptidase n=1 Tax=Paenibacillus hemerocallicola TaxID=1172614 RepID=A0A5C4T7P8_9BACL|nr:M24 family metallopeptidase [Paenibacillus hemerocallicola]TNJ64962.1 M24 family metallopeptidase [Paenibacillus hemerocallicola]
MRQPEKEADGLSPIVRDKLQRLRNMLADLQLDAVVLTLQRNVSWLAGSRSHINTASEPACCKLVVTARDVYLVASNIEAERLAEEEFVPSGFAPALCGVFVWPWHEPAVQERLLAELLAGSSRIGTDADMEAEFRGLRTVLHPLELDEWSGLGELAGEALEETAARIAAGQSEFELAAMLARNCLERELEPIVYLTAADERIAERRHPLPTSRRLESCAMLVLCARRRGKIVSATRMVHFGQPPEALVRRHRAVAEISARLHAATRPGKTWGELYASLQQFYGEAGFPGEERRHHQGGLAGYATREQLALPASTGAVQTNQLYAWNPTLPGVKSEDTLWVGDHFSACLTDPPHRSSAIYPRIEIEADGRKWSRPGLLIRAR